MREYGNHAESFNLAYDSAIYFAGPENYSKKRVVFYARHETRRRGVELGLLALALLKEGVPDVEIVIFGSDELPYALPFGCTSAGILSERELADLYRDATVGLSVSLTNYSLVPQEMLACGLPVVEMNLPPVRAVYPEGNHGIRLAPPHTGRDRRCPRGDVGAARIRDSPRERRSLASGESPLMAGGKKNAARFSRACRV
jgi:O-antigen biosynthesis protein